MKYVLSSMNFIIVLNSLLTFYFAFKFIDNSLLVDSINNTLSVSFKFIKYNSFSLLSSYFFLLVFVSIKFKLQQGENISFWNSEGVLIVINSVVTIIPLLLLGNPKFNYVALAIMSIPFLVLCSLFFKK